MFATAQRNQKRVSFSLLLGFSLLILTACQTHQNAVQTKVNEADAQLRLAMEHYEKREWNSSVAHFQQAYQHKLSGATIRRTAPSYGKALFFAKRYKEATLIMSKHYRSFTHYDRRWSFYLLSRMAQKQHKPIKTFEWQARLLPYLVGSRHKKLKTHLNLRIKQFSANLLSQLVKEHKSDEAVFPYNVMLLRLAQLHYRNNQSQKAMAYLERLYPHLTSSHPLYRPWLHIKSEIQRSPRRYASLTKKSRIAPLTPSKNNRQQIQQLRRRTTKRVKIAMHKPTLVRKKSLLRPPKRVAKKTTAPQRVVKNAKTSPLRMKKLSMMVKTETHKLVNAPKQEEPRGPEQPADALTIGVVYPMSGRGEVIGKFMRRGIDMIRLRYPKLKVVFKDTSSSPSLAAKAVETLVTQHKAVAIFGPPLSKTAMAAAKKAQELGIPFVTISPKAGLVNVGSFVFCNNITVAQMGRAVARYAYKKLRLKRLGILAPNSKYGKRQALAFRTEAQRLGATITQVARYKPKEIQKAVVEMVGTNFEDGMRISRKMVKGMQTYQKRRLYRKAKKMRKPLVPYEGLFIPGRALHVSQIAAHLHYLNVNLKRIPNKKRLASYSYSQESAFRKVQLLGNSSWYHRDLFRAGSRLVSGGVLSVRYISKSDRKAVKVFKKQYRKMYRRNPIHITAYSYDTMNLLARIAIKKRTTSRAAFRDALFQVRDFPGPTGPMTVRSDGSIVAPVRFLVAYFGRFKYLGQISLLD